MTGLNPRVRTLAVAALVATAAACSSNKSNDTPTTPTPTVSAIAVAGTAPNVGLTAQFTATATMSNATTQNVTSQATWQSSNPAIAAVNAAGIVTGVAPGDVDITATFQAVAGRQRVTVVVRTFTLTGLITDGTSGGILPNINIAITAGPRTGASTRSDATGNYTLGGLEAGAVTVSASAVSYFSQDKAMTLLADSRLDFVMARVPGCTYALSATSQTIPAAGGSFSFTATSGDACSWSASTSTSWITLGATSGNSPGTIAWTAAANTAVTPRTGSIRVSWQGGSADFTITQSGAACSFTLNPQGSSFTNAGGTGAFTVTPSDAACSWTAASDSSWLTVVAGQNGTGNGTVTYSVAAYSGGVGPRAGNIGVSGGSGFRAFAVQQQP